MNTTNPGSTSDHEQIAAHQLGLAEQDAAIAAYLDGLLRDPDSLPTEPADALVDSVDDEQGFLDEPSIDYEQIKRPASLALVDFSKYKSGVTDDQEQTEPALVPMDKESSVDKEYSVIQAQSQPLVESVATVEEKGESDWRVFALGHLKVALPRTEIFAVIGDTLLHPVPGAPANVAGAVRYQNRSRLILSLDAWLSKLTGETSVLLLGGQGLWGIRVGKELTDITWENATTQWRDEQERHGGRPWLAGVNRAAGVVFLAVEPLRAQLNAHH